VETDSVSTLRQAVPSLELVSVTAMLEQDNETLPKRTEL
jgi:hypothetical protein